MNIEQATVTSKDGTTIAYEWSGTGPTVVLVASALSDRSDTKRLAALLSEHFTVVNYDRRGRGRSTDADTWSPEREIDDLEALIDANGGTAYLFGSSSGAVLALDAAGALGTRKVRRVFSYEAPVIVDDRREPMPSDAIDQVDTMIAEGKRGKAVGYFFRTAFGASGFMIAMTRVMVPVWSKMVAMAPTLAYDNAILGVDRSVPVEAASRVKASTLVMDGGASLEAMPFMRPTADKLAKAIPNAQRRTVEGQAHDVDAKVLAPILVKFFGSALVPLH